MSIYLFTSESVTECHPIKSATRFPTRCSTRCWHRTDGPGVPGDRLYDRGWWRSSARYHPMLWISQGRGAHRGDRYDRTKYGFDAAPVR